MKVTLSQKMYGLVAFISIVMLVGTGLAFYGLYRVIDRFDTLIRVDVAQRDISLAAQASFGDAVHSYKNYLIRKDEKYVKEFEANTAKVRDGLKTYENLSGNNKEKLEEVRKAEAALVAYSSSFTELVALRRSGRDIAAVDKAIHGKDRPAYGFLGRMGELAARSRAARFSSIASENKFIGWALVAGALIGITFAWVVSVAAIRKVHKSIHAVNGVADQASTGDLSQDVPVITDDEVGEMGRSINKMMEDLRRIAGQIKGMTNTLASSTEEVSMTTESLTRGMKDQSRQTEQAAAAITEVSQTVMDVARNASEASRASKDMSRIAGEGRKKVEDTVAGMHGIAGTVKEAAHTVGELGNASKEIGTIINTINDIADQTNLLALNAAIEAARAGESGRGFAVVADEVRKLAERTGKATKEIAAMIEKIQEETARSVTGMQTGIVEVEKGVALAEEAKSALERIVSASGVSTDMIQRIAAAAEEQSAATEQVSSNMEAIASVTRTTESSIDQIRVTVLDLSRMAGELNSSAAWFKV
ncbi:MAG: methyl-accepting chemotaxis protein [Desulfobacteria bacterium]